MLLLIEKRLTFDHVVIKRIDWTKFLRHIHQQIATKLVEPIDHIENVISPSDTTLGHYNGDMVKKRDWTQLVARDGIYKTF